MTTHDVSKFLHDYSTDAVTVAAVLVAAVIATRIAKMARRNMAGRNLAGARNAATPLFALASIIGTALSTNTSWRFFRTNLGFPVKTVMDRVELIGMFSGLEVALVACAFGARQNLQNPDKRKPGAPGVVVWMLSALAAVPAFKVGGNVYAGTWRTILGPVLAVFAFHMALGMELRHKAPTAKSESVPAVIFRELTQRLYVRLGLATQNRTAQDIARERAVNRAVILYGRLKAMSADDKSGKRAARLRVRLREQLRRAGVSDSPERTDAFLAQVAVHEHTDSLFDLAFASPWTGRPMVETTPAAPAAAPEQEEQEQEAAPEQASTIERLLTGKTTPIDDGIACLLVAEPPAWVGLPIQAAVERADATLPGPRRPARELVEILAGVGITTTESYVRTARQRIKNRPADGTVINLHAEPETTTATA